MATNDISFAKLTALDDGLSPTLSSLMSKPLLGASADHNSVSAPRSYPKSEADSMSPERQSSALPGGKNSLADPLPLERSSADLDESVSLGSVTQSEQTRELGSEPVPPCANSEDLPEHRRTNVELLAEIFEGGNPIDDGLLDYIMLKLYAKEQDLVFKAIKNKRVGKPGPTSTNTEDDTPSTAAIVQFIRTQVDEMKGEVAKVQKHCGSLEAAVTGTQKDVLQWEAKHDELIGDVCVLSSCIVDAGKEVSDLKGAVNGFTCHVAFLERAIHNTCSNDVAVESGAEVASLKGFMNDLLTVSTTMKGDVTGLKFAVTNLESDVAVLRNGNPS